MNPSMQTLLREGQRQGDAYSNLVTSAYKTFWGSDWWDFVRRKKLQWTMDVFESMLPGSEPINALEIGCGIGWTALEMIRRYDRIGRLLCLDTATAAVGVANRLKKELDPPNRKRVEFRTENFFFHEGGPYHLVFMHEVFEHIPDPQAVFEKAAELVLPGGCLMISTPNYLRLDNRILASFKKPKAVLDPMHVHEYTVEEMLSLAGDQWQCQRFSGHSLLNASFFSALIEQKLGSAGKRLAPLSKTLLESELNYRLGAVHPALALELLLAYRRRSDQKKQ